MDSPIAGNMHQELVDVIRQVRRRWRMKLLLRGAIIVIGGAIVAIALASAGLQSRGHWRRVGDAELGRAQGHRRAARRAGD